MWTGTIRSPDIHTLYKVGNNVAKDFLRDHSEKMVKILDEKWDLVVVDELFAIHSFAIATFFKGREDIPYIIMSTSIMNPPAAERLALGRNIGSTPYVATWVPKKDDEKHDPTLFWQRLYNAIESVIEIFAVNIYAENFYTDSMEKYGVENFSWKKWYYESSANFLEYVDRVGFVTPTALDLIGTGSHCPSVDKLSHEIESFVSDPKSKGTIYIAFGSNVMWEFAPQPILDAFFDAVNELEDYRVIFSYNGIPRPVKSHVMLTEWAPQLEILGHPNTKAFVSHGGLKSLKESICAKVPIILMPMYAEQSFNAKTALYVGITSILNKHNLTKDALLSTIHKILNDKTYDERSQKIQKIYLDRLIHPLEEAGFRIEKIVKNKSFLKNFKRRGILLDYIEFLYFDVIGVCCCLMLVLFK